MHKFRPRCSSCILLAGDVDVRVVMSAVRHCANVVNILAMSERHERSDFRNH